MTDLPSTDWVIAVLETSRAGSMAGAAERLSHTHGAISRRIQAAEHWLGTPIFQRAGRGVHLTTQGMLFVRRAERSLGDIMALRAELSTRRSRGAVRISTLPSVARLWIMPRLATLEAALPGCSIDLIAEERLARLDAHDADLSIRYGGGSWPGVEAHILFEDFVVPAAAPRLWDILSGAPPEQLMRETLIIDCEGADWRTWCESAGIEFNPTGRQRKFLDYDLALEAARESLGVVLVRLPLSSGVLADGSLRLLDMPGYRSSRGHYLVTRRDEPRAVVRNLAATLRRQGEEARRAISIPAFAS